MAPPGTLNHLERTPGLPPGAEITCSVRIAARRA